MPLAAKALKSQPHTVVTMLDLAAWVASASSQAVTDVKETIMKDRLTALALSQDTLYVAGGGLVRQGLLCACHALFR